MKTCIDYATYLFHETHGLQCLQLPDWHSRSKGAYVRFVLALFKKKFASKIKEKPEDLLECQEDFKELISNLQKQTWAYTLESKNMIPSQECLFLREKNFSFQLQVWCQATKPTIAVPDPLKHGWKDEAGELILQPDSEMNMRKQKTMYDTIMRKCGCKTSQCLTKRCGCKKSGSECTSLCDCLNCENSEVLSISRSYDPVEIIEDEDSVSSGSDTDAAVYSDDEEDHLDL